MQIMRRAGLLAVLLAGASVAGTIFAAPANASREGDILTMIAYQRLAQQQQEQQYNALLQAQYLANLQAQQQTCARQAWARRAANRWYGWEPVHHFRHWNRWER